jgi:geranylgeranyl diphosphate synthase type II
VQFGYFLGATFQIQDDLLNIVGNKKIYGKDFAGDIIEGKRTLIMIHLLKNAADADRARLMDYYALPYSERAAQDARWVLKLMDKYGSIDFARTYARRYAGAAFYEFSQAFAEAEDSDDTSFIEALVLHALEREV